MNLISKFKSLFSKDTSNLSYRLYEGHILIVSNYKELSKLIEVLEKNNYQLLSTEYIPLESGDVGMVVKHK